MSSTSIELSNQSCFDFLKNLPNNSVDLFLIDPPYEVSRDTNFQSGELKGDNTDRFRVSMDFGDWDSGFTGLDTVISEAYRVLRKGGTLICFYDLWKLTTLKEYFEKAKFKQLRFIEWLKTNPVPINSKTNYLTNAREIAILGVKGGRPTFHSEYDNGIYKYPICHDKGRFHPTQKPLALIEELIKKHSEEGDVVVDCFSGSGTTAVAANNTGRNFIGCELSKARAITVEELEKIHPNFRSTNGCQWARSDASYLGKKYKIKREHKNGKVYSVKLDGTNRNSVNRYRGIRQDIRKEMLKRKCALLDIGVNVEVDHKNGRYDELTNTDIKTQKIQDFQPLCKPANDAKRQHCTVCKQCGKRFDARTMGYQVGWICGDENTKVCTGCFWYDIEKFNHEVSKGFVKTA